MRQGRALTGRGVLAALALVAILALAAGTWLVYYG